MGLMKGAFVVFQAPVPVPTDLIVFQFNAESLTRRLDPSTQGTTKAGNATEGGGGANHATQRPNETLTVTIELNAADALAADDLVARAVGLHPVIAQLELLMYPPSSVVLLNKALKLAGAMQIAPEFVPAVLFVWGTTRVLPVQVTSVQVDELHFDDRLNPVVAKVDVGLSVLNQPDHLPTLVTSLGTVNHLAKEALSRVGTAQSAFDVGSLLPF
jgi:hypothetical protein